MQLEEYPVYAEKLMERWSTWRRASDGMSDASYSWQKYRETFIFLTEQGLLADRSEIRNGNGNFVLKQAVHGSPILLSVGGEIIFKSLDFARECHKLCKKYANYDDVHILMVCA